MKNITPTHGQPVPIEQGQPTFEIIVHLPSANLTESQSRSQSHRLAAFVKMTSNAASSLFGESPDRLALHIVSAARPDVRLILKGGSQ